MISLPGPSRPPCFVVCDCVQNFLLLSPLQDRQREVPQRRRPAISPRAVMRAPRPESGRGPTGQKRDLLSPPGTGALAQPSSLFSEQPDRLRASWRPLWRLFQNAMVPLSHPPPRSAQVHQHHGMLFIQSGGARARPCPPRGQSLPGQGLSPHHSSLQSAAYVGKIFLALF